MYGVWSVQGSSKKNPPTSKTCSTNYALRAALIDLLSKRSSRKEVRHVEMMLSSVTKEMELSTVRVEDVSGEFSMDVCVAKVDKGELLFVDNPHYEELIRSYQHLEGVKMEDDDQKPKLPVHLILGAGDYMRAKTSEKPRVGKMGEPVAEIRMDHISSRQGTGLFGLFLHRQVKATTRNCAGWMF